MRADHVEPQELKTLLYGVASRIAAGALCSVRPAVFVGQLSTELDAVPREYSLRRRRARRVRGTSYGSALCC